MTGHGLSATPATLLPATRGQSRFAGAVVAASFAVFVLLAPFAKTPLTPVWGFIPTYEAALVVNDLVTAALLFAQFNFFLVAEEALFVVFLVRTVHARVSVVGLLLAAEGLGAIGGALVASRLAARLGVGRAMIVGATAGPLLGLLIPFTRPNAGLICFVVGAAGLGATWCEQGSPPTFVRVPSCVSWRRRARRGAINEGGTDEQRRHQHRDGDRQSAGEAG